MSLARVKRWRREWLQGQTDEWWQKQKLPTHLKSRPDAPKVWKHPYEGVGRKTVGTILGLLPAHGDYASYHRWLKHESAVLTCAKCEAEKTLEHPWGCPSRDKRLWPRFVNKLALTDQGFKYLAKNLHHQDLPGPLVRCAATFASGRLARSRLDNHIGEFRAIPHGLPQGSPASPVLFLLYLEPLLNVMPSSFGYADDVAFLCTAKTLEESSRLADTRGSQARKWCYDNGLTVADNKTEFQYLHRTQQRAPQIKVNGANHAANDSTRWLGMFLNTKLSSKTHMQHWSAKAMKVAAHTRGLGNTVRGCPTNLLRAAALAARPWPR
ncbi:hypothetical protein BROUX41_002766 [Berkeleyomyces rouxiae]